MGPYVDLSAQHAPSSAAETLRALAEEAEARSYSFDTYGVGASISRFEGDCASLLGKEAAVFCPTGTAAQQAALLSLAVGVEPLAACRPVLLLHPTSHLVFLDCLHDGSSQAAAFAKTAQLNLPDFDVRPVGEFGRVACLADVQTALALLGEMGQPATLCLELPQRMNGGGAVPLSELREMSRLCRSRGVRMHMDGARLWEVQPHYSVPLDEVAALFDSVYVSFTCCC